MQLREADGGRLQMEHAGLLRTVVGWLLPLLMCGHALMGHAAPLAQTQPPPTSAAAPAQKQEGSERHHDGPSAPGTVCEREGEVALQTQRTSHPCAAEPPPLASLNPQTSKAPRAPPLGRLAEHQPTLLHDSTTRSKLQMWLL